MSAFERLAEPFQLKGRTLSNRVVWLPHLTGYSQERRISDKHVRYYVERARNDVGMIIMGCETVNPRYRNPLRVDAFDPDSVEGYRRLSDAVHEHDTVLIGQLVDDGNQNVCDATLDWAYEYAPSAVADWAVGRIPKAMESEDFTFSRDAWVASVRNHVDGGYDGSELKIAHDGLLRQMLSPLYNQRDDQYGGDREHRERFVREVLEAMRMAAGPGHILGVRFAFAEFVAGGFELDEGLRLLSDIASWGLVDYITSDLGVHSALRFCNPPMSTPTGFARYAIRAANELVDLPLIAYGRIRTPEMAEEILEHGESDLVGVARALITDPQWVRKALRGDAARIRRCIGCNQGCLDRLWVGQEITCILNPAAGREARFGEGTLLPADPARRVLVIGGGPAGMKTAEVAARRGHRVTLIERSDQLGGAVNTIARAPSRRDFLDAVRWLEDELDVLGVDVQLGREVQSADFHRESDGTIRLLPSGTQPDDRSPESLVADTVVLATGAVALTPAVPGVESPSVVLAQDALNGVAEIGSSVVIVDGTGTFLAVSTAQMLADTGHRVTVVSQLQESAANLGPPDRQVQMTTLFEHGVELIPAYALAEIDLPAVRFVHTLSGDPLELEADTVILATGWASDTTAFQGLEGVVDRLHRVGDSVAPRDVGMAIFTAEELGRSI